MWTFTSINKISLDKKLLSLSIIQHFYFNFIEYLHSEDLTDWPVQPVKKSQSKLLLT